MKVEILEITANELLDLLSSMNYIDVATLLGEAYSIHADKKSDDPEQYKYVANELVNWCEPLIFEADTVKDAIADAKQPKYTENYELSEIDVFNDFADYQADEAIKINKGE